MTTFRTLAAVRHHGMELTDYEFSVPLDHAQASGETLSIFARAVRNSETESATRPWLVFLQGGPGFPGPRPLTNRAGSSALWTITRCCCSIRAATAAAAWCCRRRWPGAATRARKPII
jgi:hypothetical protein